jgi:hypothetical protein
MSPHYRTLCAQCTREMRLCGTAEAEWNKAPLRTLLLRLDGCSPRTDETPVPELALDVRRLLPESRLLPGPAPPKRPPYASGILNVSRRQLRRETAHLIARLFGIRMDY